MKRSPTPEQQLCCNHSKPTDQELQAHRPGPMHTRLKPPFGRVRSTGAHLVFLSRKCTSVGASAPIGVSGRWPFRLRRPVGHSGQWLLGPGQPTPHVPPDLPTLEPARLNAPEACKLSGRVGPGGFLAWWHRASSAAFPAIRASPGWRPFSEPWFEAPLSSSVAAGCTSP